jgi:hypothetical protein
MLVDQMECGALFGAIFGERGWRPPSRKAMANSIVNQVCETVRATVNFELRNMAGGCLQFDGWTDPACSKVFSVLFGAPLPFYITVFRIMGLREASVTLATRIKDVMVASSILPQEAERRLSWEKQRTVAIVNDAPNIMTRARRDMLTADMFSFY